MPPLPRISVSVKAAVIRDSDVLLLSYDDAMGFHYNLPGGKAREGECLRDAVHRKVAEETGLRVRARRLLFVVEYVPEAWQGEFGDVQKVQFNFLAEPLDDVAPRMPDPPDADHVGFEWVPVTALASKYLLPRVAPQLLDALGQDRSDCLVDRW